MASQADGGGLFNKASLPLPASNTKENEEYGIWVEVLSAPDSASS